MKKLRLPSTINQANYRITNNFYLFRNFKFEVKIDLLRELMRVAKTIFKILEA